MAKTKREKPSLAKYSVPRYWPTWALLAFMKLVAHLPFWLQIRIGQAIGYLTFLLVRQRRHICEVILKLCYPELNYE